MFRPGFERIAAAFGNLSLTAKGVLVPAIPVCALLAAMAGFYGFEDQTRDAQSWVEHTFQVRSEIQTAVNLVATAEGGTRGYLLTRQESYLTPYWYARTQLPEIIGHLRKLASDNPPQEARLSKLETLIGAELASMEQLRASSAGGAAPLQNETENMRKLISEAGAMAAEEDRLLTERTQRERRAQQRLDAVIAAGVATGLLGGILGALVFTTSILRRIQGVEADARRVAAGVPISGVVTGNDEIASLAQTLKETSQRLQQQTEQLRAAQSELETRVGDRTAQLSVANEELRQSNQVRQALIKSSPLATWAMDLEGKVIFWNPAAEKLFGWTEAETIGKPLPIIPENQRAEYAGWLQRFRQGEALSGMERVRQKKDGSLVEVSIWTAPLAGADGVVNGTIALDSDITQRKVLEEQFRQSQKLEAVGRLAGGVAHDFNNLLTVIMGYLEMLITEAADRPELVEYAHEIQYAASRASSLTGQLLAFSRRQISQPKVLDLNEIVTHSIKLLRRVIGEDIEIITRLEPLLGRIKADPIHIDQLIMNLVVNARDAMSEGGKLTIETSNSYLDDTYTGRHIGVKNGYYSMLAVSDTGSGMSADVRSRLFEPFFTTKEAGKGTGLGLSIVYGVVKQNGGDIVVYTEPGRGTTFKIYLPMVEVPAEIEALEVQPEGAKGSETVLVCEDEQHIRRLVLTMLTRQGYNVLETESPDHAIQVAQRYKGRIDLLLTDVVMPGINGFELAKAVTGARPETKVLYMSGYTDHRVNTAWVLDAGTPFLNKPFTVAALTQKVRETLEKPIAAA